MDRRDAKRNMIHAAAISEFTKHGLAGTSMASIAAAAGMSRPALYQYFRDKSHIFASAFVAVFEERVEGALAALTTPGSTLEQLDNFLQRYEGDLWEALAASPHAEELLSAKSAELSAAIAEVVVQLPQGLARYLDERVPGSVTASERQGWIEILRLAPQGLKSDQPSVEAFRRRLHTLACGVASDIDNARR